MSVSNIFLFSVFLSLFSAYFYDKVVAIRCMNEMDTCGKNKQEKLRATKWQVHDFYICHENHESVTPKQHWKHSKSWRIVLQQRVTTIGLNQRMLVLEKPVWRERKRLTSPEVWGLAIQPWVSRCGAAGASKHRRLETEPNISIDGNKFTPTL